MNESELQLHILQKYYDRRKELKVILSPDDFGGHISQNEIWRVSLYLCQKGQIEWTSLEWNSGVGKITAIGVDVIGKATSRACELISLPPEPVIVVKVAG